MRPVRVLALGVHWFEGGSGGLDRVFHDLALALPDADVAVTALVLNAPGSTSPRPGLSVASYGARGGLAARLLAARRSVARRLGEGGTDLLAAHFALFAAPSLDRLGARPFVAHFHGPWADESKAEGGGALPVAVKRAVERRVYRRADRIIVLSWAFADVARQRYGVPEDRLRVVPGSVDLGRFRAEPDCRAARLALGWPCDRPILLCVRRLAKRMGLDLLIAGMPAIVAAVPDVLLMIAGAGQLALALRAQVEALGMSRHVRFLGFVPEADLPLAYRAATLAVLPSSALEGFGLAAIEALACGTPAIVTPVGGLAEVVAPLAPELVMLDASSAAMADRLTAALLGRLAMPDAAACRAHVASRYAPALAAARVAGVYREVA